MLTPIRASLYACLAAAFVARAGGGSLSNYFSPSSPGIAALAADGKHVAFEEAPIDGRPARLVLLDLSGSYTRNEMPLAGKTKGTANERVKALEWSESDRLLVETTSGRVFSLDANALNLKDCQRVPTPVRDEKKPEGVPSMIRSDVPPVAGHFHVTSFPKAGSRLAVVATDDQALQDARSATLLLSFDVATGATVEIAHSPFLEGTGDYGYDLQGRVRWKRASVWSEDRVATAPDGWRGWVNLRDEVPPDYRDGAVYPLGSEADSAILLVSARKAAGRYIVATLNIRTFAFVPLLTAPGSEDCFDPKGLSEPLVVDWRAGSVVGIRGRGLEPGVFWREAAFSVAQEKIEQQFPGRRVDLLGWSAARDVFVARVAGEGEPGRLFVIAAKAWDLPLEIARLIPRLSAEDLSPSARIDLPLSGSLRLRGWLTLPSAPALPRLPLIVLPPASAPHEGYDARAQALASMGYVVFAASGLIPGRSWREAVNLLAEKGPVDSSKVAVFGEGAEALAREAGFGYWVEPRLGRRQKGVLAMAAPGTSDSRVLDGPLGELQAADVAAVYRDVDSFLTAHGAPRAAPTKGWFWQ